MLGGARGLGWADVLNLGGEGCHPHAAQPQTPSGADTESGEANEVSAQKEIGCH